MENYAKNCELVLGLVCPIGVNLDDVETRLESIFKQFNYQMDLHHLSVLAKTLDERKEPSVKTELDRLDQAMRKGTTLRNKYQRGDLYALLAINAISRSRGTDKDRRTKPFVRRVHVIRSLKHADEVETLRSVYGAGFFLLGISASTASRRHYLKELKGVPEDDLDRLIARDDKENDRLGQQTREVFHLADAFVTTDDAERLSTQLTRIFDLLFSKTVVPPTAEEYGMFMAYAASLRSADLSRQVGAVIMNEHSDIVSSGANDVPRFDGGLYWPGQKDQRDFMRGFDSNDAQKQEIISDVITRLLTSKKGKQSKRALSAAAARLKGSRIMDVTEYGRAVHAEMEAILQAARNGARIRHATLFTTTYPCHNCAKHIVAAGIREVVYVEPYPKSYATKLHDDSIDSIGKDAPDKVKFRQFVGVGPRRFFDLFSVDLSSGRKIRRKVSGKLVKWQRAQAELRVPMTPLSYLDSEQLLVTELSKIMLRRRKK